MRGLGLVLAATLALSGAAPAGAQQVADVGADVSVAQPAWAAGAGPRVVVDGGHNNFHTVDGRFAPFAGLLRADGLTVGGSVGPVTRESLTGVRLLVVANALHASNADGAWTLPTPSAFTPAEIAVLKAWVEEGGALLLIADHMPFAGAATDLAAAFGFTLSNGFILNNEHGRPDIFTIAAGTLADDPVTRGRNDRERITRLRTFTGSAFRAPSGARPLITLPGGYRDLRPAVAWKFDATTPASDPAGWLQGAVVAVGRGRVAVFGEAAMFTAQTANGTRMGFNAPDAPDNKQFVLNLVHWLTGVLPD